MKDDHIFYKLKKTSTLELKKDDLNALKPQATSIYLDLQKSTLIGFDIIIN